MDNNLHKPIMCAELVHSIISDLKGTYIDGTIGRAGHAQALLQALDKDAQLLAWDQDVEAINYIKNHNQDSRLTLNHGNFTDIKTLLPQYENSISGIYLDLGVSSPQLDNPERGFSFMNDGPLDMRMNTSQELTAADWLATVEEKELADTIYKYGEEPKSRHIAKAIVTTRTKKPLLTTQDLVKCVISAARYKTRSRKHPATRTFQAIRIKINNELQVLEHTLPVLLQLLKPGGRLAVLSFHSLEDRIVKQTFKQWTYKDQTAPCKWITKKQRASEDEIKNNPRARSALLRIVEK